MEPEPEIVAIDRYPVNCWPRIFTNAPALAVALEAADIALMADDPLKVEEALRHGRKARRVSMQNIVFSIAILAAMSTRHQTGEVLSEDVRDGKGMGCRVRQWHRTG